MKRMNLGDKRAFTLLELLIVVVVLAVLAGLALPQYLKTVGRSKEAEGWQTLASLRSSLMRYYAENQDMPTAGAFNELDVDDPNDNALQPNRVFDYTLDTTSPDIFTVSADPAGGAGTGAGGDTGVRTLTIDNTGARTSVP